MKQPFKLTPQFIESTLNRYPDRVWDICSVTDCILAIALEDSGHPRPHVGRYTYRLRLEPYFSFRIQRWYQRYLLDLRKLPDPTRRVSSDFPWGGYTTEQALDVLQPYLRRRRWWNMIWTALKRCDLK